MKAALRSIALTAGLLANLALPAWSQPTPTLATPALATPDLLDFFSIAIPTESTPRIDNFDETWLITGPISEFTSKVMQGPSWLQLEGKVVYAYYRFQPGDNALQVQRAFEKAAAEAGYAVSFSCSTQKGDCFSEGKPLSGVSLGILLDKPTDMPALESLGIVRNYFYVGGARLTYVTKDEGSGVTHMQVAFADTPEKGVMAVTKSVITGTPPELSKASSMHSKLLAGESVSLDNLLFDTDSAILLPPSRDQLFEIAMMLRENPALKLQIIGHTDSDGGRDHNQGLSERRAAAVVDTLANGFDIEAGRLASSGRGMDAPVASNGTADGKAKNRRVELKLQ